MSLSKTVGSKLPSYAVWLLRVITGATFIVSGWAKCVDPAGFVYKIKEYLAAWNMSDVFAVDIILITAVAISLFELVTGVLLATGCMKRAATVCGLAMMTFMLPLTIYIYVADPVSDCGCFGDLIILSNGITLLKNVVITAFLILLLVGGKMVKPLVRPSLQWLVIAVTTAYGLTLAIIGWQFQPVVDFRPWPVGAEFPSESVSESQPTYVYTKDGIEQEFKLDSLPDSTWMFVGQVSRQASDEGTLAAFDGDIEVTDEVLDPEAQDGDLLILVVNDPHLDYLTRARMANELNNAVSTRGGRMIALVAAYGETLEQWIEIAGPEFEVYSSGDTGLKQLARGNAAIVAVRDGRILWKRALATLNPDILSADSPVDAVRPVDDGDIAIRLSSGWLAAMLLLIAIDRLSRPRRKNIKQTAENGKDTAETDA